MYSVKFSAMPVFQHSAAGISPTVQSSDCQRRSASCSAMPRSRKGDF
ncbi:MAG: hypothetical protein GQF41_3752 [Candidatus Rifleibacterium amylolyticum]|nr:MAG: hypothetical protein GQF41_3752 [Candidatus Rifleibacterium amylolyticum]